MSERMLRYSLAVNEWMNVKILCSSEWVNECKDTLQQWMSKWMLRYSLAVNEWINVKILSSSEWVNEC